MTPSVRTWLDRLATLYETLRRHAEIEPLYQRSLAIVEKARGPEHADLLSPLNNLAFHHLQQRRYTDAEPLFKRALAIAEKQRGADDPSLRNPLNNLAMLYKRQGRYAEAEPLYKRVLAVAEKDRAGPDNTYVQGALNDLIEVYQEQARFDHAEPLMRRVFAIAEKRYEADPQNVVSHMTLHQALNRLGKLLQETARLAEAETLFRRALAIDEKRWGPIDQHVFTDLINLGGLLQETNRLAEAEPLLRRALALAEGYGPGYEQARALNSLGALLREMNRPAEAEALHRRALPLTESFGYEPHIASTLGNLAGLLQDANRLEEAEPLYRRALAIHEKTFGPDHPNVAIPLNNLATLLQLGRRYPEAEPLYRRAVAIGEKAYGPDHPRVATRLGNLADLLQDTERPAEAEPLMRRALAIDEASYGPDHPKVAKGLSNLARLLKDTKRLTEAGELVQRALAIDEKSYGPDHARVATDLNNLAVLRSLEGRWADAVALYARAKPILVGRGGEVDAGLAKARLTQNSWSLRHYARATHRAAARSAPAREQGFELAQWALQTDAADALAQMSARFAKGQGPLVELVRERQDLVARRLGEDKRLLAAVGRSDAPVVEALRASIADLDKSLGRVDGQLTGAFPEYAGLANPKPLATADVQALLNVDEALVLFLDVRQLGELPEETIVWVVTKKGAAWYSVPMGTRALSDSVMALRCGLDQTLWSDDDGADTCRAALKGSASQDSGGQAQQGLPFDVARAHQLYMALFGPVREAIKDKQLLVVASGPLASLPFSVLVTEPPRTAIPDKATDYRRVAWLGTRQPISVLPSVGSLAALRRLAKSSAAPDAFLGYGDPVLVGQPGCGKVAVPDQCPDEAVEVTGSARLATRGAKGLRCPRRLLPRRPGQCGRGEEALPAARHGARTQMRRPQPRRRCIGGGARQGHDRSHGQGGAAQPLPHRAFRHARPAGRRDGTAHLGARRAGSGPVAARPGHRGGRRPAHRLGGGRPEARRRLGGPVGLQHRRRRRAQCGSALGPRPRVLLCRRPRPARLALAGQLVRRHHADQPHLRRDAQVSHHRPGGGVPPRHAGADERRQAPLGGASVHVGAVRGGGSGRGCSRPRVCRRRRKRRASQAVPRMTGRAAPSVSSRRPARSTLRRLRSCRMIASVRSPDA